MTGHDRSPIVEPWRAHAGPLRVFGRHRQRAMTSGNDIIVDEISMHARAVSRAGATLRTHQDAGSGAGQRRKHKEAKIAGASLTAIRLIGFHPRDRC